MAKTVLALALGSAAAFSPNAAPRATTIVRSDPNIKTDVGSGWKPESGGFSSTDTPDFFYDDDDERGDINNKIGFTDGIMGSTGLDKLKEQNTGGNNPGVEGALDVDPDVIGGYTCATAEAAGVKFELTTLAKMGRFDQEVYRHARGATSRDWFETVSLSHAVDATPHRPRGDSHGQAHVHGLRGLLRGWSPETPPGFPCRRSGEDGARGGEPSFWC